MTIPFLKIIHNLCSSQSELIDLIKKKDDEIYAYKSKGKELSLRSIKTKEFETHDKPYEMLHTMFEQSGEPQTMIHNLVDKLMYLNHETETDAEVKITQSTSHNKVTEGTSQMKIAESNSQIKIEPQINELPFYANGTMNVINSDNIKREVTDSSHSISETPIKKPKKLRL